MYTIIVCHDKLVSRIEIGLMTECLYLEQHMQFSSCVHQFSCSQGRVLHAFWLKGGHFEVKDGHPDFFTNNMIFLECGVIALFEAFYMFRDHNHVKMKF